MENSKDTYFKFHYFLLRFFGLGYFHDPSKNEFKNFSKPLYLIYSIIQNGFWVILFSVVLWMDIPYIYHDLDRLMLNLTFSITFTSSFVKIYIILFHNKTIQEIIYSLEHDLCKFMQNEKILRKTVEICKKLTISVLTFANLTVLGLVVGGTIQALLSPKIFEAQNKSKKFAPSDRILPMPVYLPFDVGSDFIYAVSFIYEILGIQWYGNLVVVINTFMNTIMVHFAGKFSNLKYVLENIKPISIERLLKRKALNQTKEEYVKLNSEELSQIYNTDIRESMKENGISEADVVNEMCLCLRECIKHHIALLECVEKFENLYTIGFLSHVLNNLSVICHVMIQISENDLLSIRCGTAVALFFTVVSELLVQCYAGNELTLQATGLAESAYKCQWYATDKRFKSLLMILMIRAQKPVAVTAGKFVTISNTTFVTIMRGAYSFYAVIRSTK